MKNIGNIIKTLQNIMRKDPGVSGDAQRIEQLGWMITLKIIDDKDQELELLHDDYVSPIPANIQWRNWAADDEGMTGEELQDFIDNTLFPTLKNLDVSNGNKRALIIREIVKHYPDHGIVAEESGSRHPDAPVQWYVDPLDGTTNYMHGHPHFAVSIAAWKNGKPLLAVVHDPLREHVVEEQQTRNDGNRQHRHAEPHHLKQQILHARQRR